MTTPTDQEMTEQVNIKVQEALSKGASVEDVNNILTRTGLPRISGAEVAQAKEPSKVPSAFEAFNTSPSTSREGGFASSTGGFASGTSEGFGEISGGFIRKPVEEKTATKTEALGTQIQEKQERFGYAPTISNEQMETTGGKIANLLVAGFTKGVGLIAETLFTAGAKVSRQANKSGVSERDFALYESAQKKQENGALIHDVLKRLRSKPQSAETDRAIRDTLARIPATRLTKEEDFIFNEASIEAGDIYGRKTIADKIQNVQEANEFIEHTEDAFKQVASYTNNKLTDIANTNLKESLIQGVEEYTAGDELEGIGTILEGFGDLATKDIYGATQTFVESVPYMVALVAGGAVALPADIISRYDKSVEAFTKEFKEAPTDAEDNTMKLMAVVASLTDKLSAGATAKAGTITKKILENTKKLNVRLPSTVKTGLVAVGAPVGSAIVEGATEGAQNILEQTAATLRDPKVKPVEVLTNIAHGAFGGVAFSAPSTIATATGLTGKAVGKAAEVTTKAAKQIKDKVTEGIGEQTEPRAKVAQIIQEGIGGLDPDKRVGKITELVTLNQEIKKATPEGEEVSPEELETDRIITSLINEHKEMVEREATGKSTTEHIASLEVEDTPEQQVESDTSIKEVATTMKEGTAIPLGSAEKVFGSAAFKRATPEDQKVITEYVDFLKTIDSVGKDVREGKGDFKGLNTHLEELGTATLVGDSSTAKVVIQSLQNFQTSHSNKLKGLLKAQASPEGKAGQRVEVPLPNNETTFYEKGRTEGSGIITKIQSEVDAIGSTIDRAKGIYQTAFNSEVTLEPVVEPEVAVQTTQPEIVKGQVEGKAERKANLNKKRVSSIRQAISEAKTPELKLNAASRLKTHANLVNDSALASEAESVISELKEQGYETQVEVGDKFDNRQRLKADFVEDPTIPEGQEVITKVRKPQINKDGVMVQSAEVVVGVGTKATGQVEDKVAPTLTPIQTKVAGLKQQLAVLGDKDNKLSPEFEVERQALNLKLDSAKTEKAAVLLRKEIAIFKAETRKPLVPVSQGVTDIARDEGDAAVLGTKGSPRKSLGENLVNDYADTSLSVPKTKVSKTIGNKAETSAATLFKVKAKQPEGFFNQFHNFFTRYKAKGNQLTSAMKIKVGKVNEQETKILDTLTAYNDKFTEAFSAVDQFLTGGQIFPEYKNDKGVQILSTLDQNPLGYLVKVDKAGKRYYNENLIGIMSTVTFNWIGTRGMSTLYNTDSDINSILGRDSSTKISRYESFLFRNAGTTRTSLAEDLGGQVVKQTGLDVQDNVDGQSLDKLTMAIGLTMLGALSRQGLIEDYSVSAKDMGDAKGDLESSLTFNPKAATKFIRIKADPENIYEPVAEIRQISDDMAESTDFLNRVFSVAKHERYVSTVPTKYVAKKLKGSVQNVPNKIKRAIVHMQKVKWGIKENVHGLISVIDPKTLEALAGVVKVDKTTTHIDNIESMEAKNEDIKRTLANYNKSIHKLETEGGIFQDIHFQYEAWKNMRIGVVTNMLNPQGNKIHRHMLGAKAWEVEVTADGSKLSKAMRTNFKLAVAQSFNFDIDKKNPEASVDFFESLLTNETVREGIQAVLDLKQASISPEAKVEAEAALIAAVAMGEENLHSLDGLIALSEYSETGTFKTNLGIEVDGVTNGVAFGLMQSPLEAGMDRLLASVGIYLNAESGISYPEWKSRAGNYDLYEKLAVKWVGSLDLLRGDSTLGKKLAVIEEIVGKFIENDEITSLGRKFSKDPLMFTNYGAGMKGIVREFNNSFMQSIIDKLEAASRSEDVAGTTKALVEGVYLIAGMDDKIPTDIDYTKPLELQIPFSVQEEVAKALTSTYGASLETALEEQFKEFFKFRETFNTSMNVIFVVFKMKYDAAIKEAEYLKGMKLTAVERKKIFTDLQEYHPTFKSSVSEGVEDSLGSIKTNKVRPYDDAASRVQVAYAKGATNFENNSAVGTVSHIDYVQPGVGSMVMGTHAQDGNTQATTGFNFDYLNQHDAKIMSIADIDAGTKETNQGFWDITTDYSVMDSAYESYLRVMDLVKDDPAVLKEVNSYLKTLDRKNPLTLGQFSNKFTNLKEKVDVARTEIKNAPNVGVGQYAHGSDSMAMQNETADKVGLGELVNKAMDQLDEDTDVDIDNLSLEDRSNYVASSEEVAVAEVADRLRSKLSKSLNSLINQYRGPDAAKINTASKVIKNNLLKFMNSTVALGTQGILENNEKEFSSFNQETGKFRFHVKELRQYSQIVNHELNHAATVYGFDEAIRTKEESATQFIKLLEGHKDKVLAAIDGRSTDPNVDYIANRLNYIYADNSGYVADSNNVFQQQVYRAKEAIAILSQEPEVRAQWNAIIREVDKENVKYSSKGIKTLLKFIVNKVSAFINQAVNDFIAREKQFDKDLGTKGSTALNTLYEVTAISLALNNQVNTQKKLTSAATVLSRSVDSSKVLKELKRRPTKKVETVATPVVESTNNTPRENYVPIDFDSERKGETVNSKDFFESKPTTPVDTQYDERNPPPFYGSSIDAIDMDNFTSHYDSLLTADNSVQIFEDMEGFGNKTENPTHRAHLKEVLENVVNTVLTASDSVLFRVGDTDKVTHGSAQGERVYINASAANRLNSNSEMSVQETQVHELLHTILAYAIDHDFHARKELIKLFNQVEGKITWEDFMHKDVNGNTLIQIDQATEEAAAKERFNYIFGNSKVNTVESVDPESGLITTKSSNAYLHEFVSFGLTNEVMKKKLSTIGSTPKATATKGLSLYDKLAEWYVRALNWVSGRFYHTKDVSADVALRNLAEQLAGIHSKRRTQSLRFLTLKQDLNDKLSKAVVNKIIKPFEEWRESKLNEPSSPLGKAMDAIAIIPLTYRSSEFRKVLKKVLRNVGFTEENVLAKLVREIQGAKSNNAKWFVLLRHSKHVIDNARKSVATGVLKDIRASFVAGLPDKDESKAITRALFKTDLSVLVGAHTIADVVGFLRSESKLGKAIQDTKAELSSYGSNGNYYINQARGLGNMLSTATGMVDQQMTNAYAIATLATTGEQVTGDVTKAEEIIDRLASLYALRGTATDQKKLLSTVIEREYLENSEDNGIIHILNLQRGFKEEAQEKLFNGNKTLMAKGYISESFNPNTDIKIATLAEEDALAKSGYVRGKVLAIDTGFDPNTEKKYMYVSKNNVGNTYLKSIASLTSRTVKGSTLLDGYQTIGSGTPTQDAQDAKKLITLKKRVVVANQFASPNVTARNENTLVPILNEKGVISGYRYMMTEINKLSILERDDSFDSVMGDMWGSIKDKVNSKDVNTQVIQMAYEDYKEGFAEDPNAYVRIAADSSEDRYNELFHLLPEEVRRDMKEIWGKKEIYIKRELSDLIFGYRKASIANSRFFQNESINKIINVAKVRHVEAIWQEIVSVSKTNIVIRNPAVLMANFVSNLALSWVKGVPATYIVKNQALALRALNSYQKDVSARDTLERKLKIDKALSPTARSYLEVRLARLKDEVTNNPVRPLVDEGIFQSIVEDVDDTSSPFSYRDRLMASDRVQKFTNRLGTPIKDVSRQAVMTEDTAAFKTLMKATQYSDFIARFALHKHNTEVKGMDKQKSLADVIKTFVEYDGPTSKQLQWLNDVGLFMFSKFLFRIQGVIFTIVKDHPANVLALLTMQSYFGEIPDVMDSNLITGSILGRVNLSLEPLDTATDLSGLKNAAEFVGF